MSGERLTVEQAAAHLGVSISTLGRLRRAGRIPYLKLSDGKAVYERDELDRWLESRRHRPQDVPA
jgi:excisionase family DNA binding protein